MPSFGLRVLGVVLSSGIVGFGACSSGETASTSSNEYVVELQPNEVFVASGLEGGPFLPASQSFQWTNRGANSIAYSRTVSASWIAVAGPAQGLLEPGETLDLELSLIAGQLGALAVGDHTARVTLTAPDGLLLNAIDVRLTVDPLSQGYSMNLVPPSGLSSSGPAGGPLSPIQRSYAWANNGVAPVDYTQTVSETWLVASGPASGTVPAGQVLDFDISLDSTVADFAVGSYTAAVRFLEANSNAQLESIDIQVTVDADSVTISPATDFVATGSSGGPFSPISRTFTVTNHGAAALSHSRTLSQSWVAATGLSSGTLQPGESFQFTVSLDDARTAVLPAGQHRAEVSFLDTATNGVVANLDVVLTVQGAAGDLGFPQWSTPQQQPGSRTIHVSVDGSDSTGDGSTGSPYATIERGWQDVRNGSSDWLLLERGGTWTAQLSIDKGGIDVDHPLAIGVYGSGPRPIIQHNNGPFTTRFDRTHNFVSVIGLRLQPVGWTETDPMISGSAFSVKGGTCDDWVIEDCFFGGFNNGLTLDGKSQPSRRQRTVVRGCIFVGNHVHIYADDTDDGLFEYNYFHRPVLRPTGDGGYPHSIYHQAGNQRLTIRRNCFGFGDDTRSSGVEFRGNHTILADNYMFRTDAGVWMGSHSPTAPPPAGGLQIQIERNVFDAMIGQSDDVHLAHVAGGTYRSNLHINRTSGNGACLGLARGAQNSNPLMTGVHNLDIDNLVVYSTAADSRVIQVLSSANSDITIRRSKILAGNFFLYAALGRGSLFTSYANEWSSTQTGLSYLADAPSPGPTYLSTEYVAFLAEMADPPSGELASVLRMPSFTESARSGATYVDMVEGVGGSSYQDLADRLLAQTKDSWNADYSAPRINAWLQEGFDVSDSSNGTTR